MPDRNLGVDLSTTDGDKCIFLFVGINLTYLQNSSNFQSYRYEVRLASKSVGFEKAYYHCGIRTPLVVAGPGIKGPKQVDSFAYITDIMPTILEFAGMEQPEQYRGREVERMRGKSLAGVISGSDEYTYARNAVIGGEMLSGRWMRKGDYKAVLVAKDFGPGVWKLYNVAKDPGETRDLSEERPGILEELTSAWQRYAQNVGVILSK